MYEHIDMKKTGILLKYRIEKAGYTVKDIQKILQLSCPQPIYRWFKGMILPSVDHLYVLSRLLKVHMEDLLVPQCERKSNKCPNADPEQQRPKAGYHHGDGILPFVLYPPVLSWESVVYSSWFNKSEFERRKLMYPLISVFIIVVGALLLVFANKIIKNNKVNRIGIKVVGGILIIVGLLLLYFLLSGKLTLPLSK